MGRRCPWRPILDFLPPVFLSVKGDSKEKPAGPLERAGQAQKAGCRGHSYFPGRILA